MPSRCSVPGCTSNHCKFGEHITSFRFPTNVDLKRSWEKAFGNEFNAKNSSRACIKHFEDKYYYFDKSDSRRLLTKNAIPTIDMPILLDSSNDSFTFDNIIGALKISEKSLKFSIVDKFICLYVLEFEDVPKKKLNSK